MPQLWNPTQIVFLALVSFSIALLVGGEMLETLRRRAAIRLRSARRGQRR